MVVVYDQVLTISKSAAADGPRYNYSNLSRFANAIVAGATTSSNNEPQHTRQLARRQMRPVSVTPQQVRQAETGLVTLGLLKMIEFKLTAECQQQAAGSMKHSSCSYSDYWC